MTKGFKLTLGGSNGDVSLHGFSILDSSHYAYLQLQRVGRRFCCTSSCPNDFAWRADQICLGIFLLDSGSQLHCS